MQLRHRYLTRLPGSLSSESPVAPRGVPYTGISQLGACRMRPQESIAENQEYRKTEHDSIYPHDIAGLGKQLRKEAPLTVILQRASRARIQAIRHRTRQPLASLYTTCTCRSQLPHLRKVHAHTSTTGEPLTVISLITGQSRAKLTGSQAHKLYRLARSSPLSSVRPKLPSYLSPHHCSLP